MASLIGGGIQLDYSMWSGKVSYFKLDGQVYLDADENICKPGWDSILYDFAKDCGFTEDNGRGLRAWVIPLLDRFT